jgi:predicted phage tail protein
MDKKLTKIVLHGTLGKAAGRGEWDLQIDSANEALHAINVQTHDSLRRYFLNTKNAYGRYKVLVNEKEISPGSKFSELNEMAIIRGDFKRLDIIPVLEGSDWLDMVGTFGGFWIFAGAENPYTAMIGLMLMSLGASNLLAQPPAMPDTRQMLNPSSDPQALANSYLFGGPVNVINEGGPVPVGYGRLIVGSQVVMSSYDVAYAKVDDAGKVA